MTITVVYHTVPVPVPLVSLLNVSAHLPVKCSGT